MVRSGHDPANTSYVLRPAEGVGETRLSVDRFAHLLVVDDPGFGRFDHAIRVMKSHDAMVLMRLFLSG